jgi:Uncharacterized protein containing LysM domain
MQKPIITLLCAASMIISSHAVAENLRIKPTAPARYTVQSGDTLWGISGKYLYRPWKWPSLWNMNRSKIHNPHWIYPGQVLVLRYINGRPVLGVEGGNGGIPTIKLHPHMRDLGTGYAIPLIDLNFYHMFMKTPQFMSDTDLANAARLVSGPDSRIYYAQGDRVYADGIKEPGTYLVFRINRDLKDPVSKKDLGKLVEFSGEVATLSTADSALSYRKAEAELKDDEYYVQDGNKQVVVHTAQPMVVTKSISEIHKGDFLIKRPDNLKNFNYAPHEPAATDIQADIINIMDGVEESGTMQTLILNKGLADGLDEGTVLSIYRRGKILKSDYKEKDAKTARMVNTPNQEIGLALIYRASEHVSSAIILESITNVNRGDLLAAPGQDLDTFGGRTKAENGLQPHFK